MLYRKFGNTNIKLSGIGMGMTRFSPSMLNSYDGREQCAQLIINAIDNGVNYIDNAHNYANGMSESICKIVLDKVQRNSIYIGAKSSQQEDKTAADVLRRIENSLKSIDTDYIDFFYMWSIMNGSQYEQIMKKDGPYEGVLEAKKRGLIKHILFSNHADIETAKKIINDKVFEGVLLSYNLLNYRTMDYLLDEAYKFNMGVLIMNPLAGGIIPQNKNFFSPTIYDLNESISQAAMRFVYSHPQVTCVLSGISNQNELNENLEALSSANYMNKERIKYVGDKMKQMSGLCTGCGYCRKQCKSQIPIPEMMQAYNMRLLCDTKEIYRRTDSELLKRIISLKKLILELKVLPEDSKNKCLKCGACEKVCTQHLDIIHSLEKMYEWIDISCASINSYKQRFEDLLHNKGYKKVGFWTAAGYTAFVLNKYIEFFGNPDFDIVLFDKSTEKQGKELLGYMTYSSEEVLTIKPDCIIISNYNASEEIYKDIKKYEEYGIKIIKLHLDNDVPWVF